MKGINMTTDQVTVTQTAELPIKHQLGKLLIGVIAGFIATKMAEKSYDKYVAHHDLNVADSSR